LVYCTFFLTKCILSSNPVYAQTLCVLSYHFSILEKRNKSRSQRRNSIHTGVDNDTTEGKTSIKPLAKVVQVKKKLNSPILIAGFPGAGLVGSISTSYIINRLHMNQIACVESEFIVPGVIYAEGKLRHPFRLYSNERGDVCVLVCEAPVMIQGMHSVLDTVSKWILSNNVREVLVLDGIAVEGLPSSRTPIILSTDGREADAANLIHDYNGDVTKKEETVDNAGKYLSNYRLCGRNGWRSFVLLFIK
jgi:hypothetical protein